MHNKPVRRKLDDVAREDFLAAELATNCLIPDLIQ